MNTHLLPVPFEIAEVINSFIYYDWNTWIRLEKERIFMEDLKYRMIHCYVNHQHNNDHDGYYYDDDYDYTELLIWLAVPPNVDTEMQFQPRFCKKCGNYVYKKPFCIC
jgi:hypothetical protein